MLYRFTSLLLAAMAFGIMAHGKILPLMVKDNMTSLFEQGNIAHSTVSAAESSASTASGHKIRNLDKTKDERRTSSAVQDWSLVCQQLCGAALGGAACTPYCGNVPQSSLEVQIANADILMASNQHYICPHLCGLQLGDAVCTCKNWIADDYKCLEKTNVCAIFCDYAHVTLAGCSPCGKITGNGDNTIPSGDNVDIFNEALILNKVDGTTTISNLRAATPNWNELCTALCKTGDGGSLCNCDISPFMV